MLHKWVSLAVFGLGVVNATIAQAQTAVLLASALGSAPIAGLQIAKVMGNDSSLWLSVELAQRARLAVVTAQTDVEVAPGADAWLRALDSVTRIQVAAPLGAFAQCGRSGAAGSWPLVDSGLPEAASVLPIQIWTLDSELDLRRTLADAGLTVELAAVSRFAAQAALPYRVALYQAPAAGARTAALRIIDHGHADELPRIVGPSLVPVPLSLIALAEGTALPAPADYDDPSEFSVTYQAASRTTDYVEARARWLSENSGRWLSEARDSAALFAWTAFTSNAASAPAVLRYFRATSGADASACQAQAERARTAHSRAVSDFACEGADDLAQSLGQLGFGEVRLSRLFGSLGVDGARLQVVPGEARNPALTATEFDTRDCVVSGPMVPAPVVLPPSVAGVPAAGISEPAEASYSDAQSSESVATSSDGSCQVTIFGSSSGDSTSSDGASSDSCSGDTSSSDDSSSDSCGGDTSNSDGSNSDSCSGDSSGSDSTSSDSCSGNSDSKSDSDGCGKSEYDGDTCSGNSQSNADSKASTLRSGSAEPRKRPRPVRLSLLTLLAAALALPLRRLSTSR